MKIVKIILVDDHPVVLLGLKDNITKLHSSFDVVATFSDDAGLLSYIKENKVDVIVTDYLMPKNLQTGDGINYIRFLRRNYPNIGIVVLTMVTNPMVIHSLYDEGVLAVITKETPMDILIRAIQLASQSKVYKLPSEEVSTVLKSQKALTLNDKVKTLSPREFEVLRLFVQGKSVVEISKLLNRSDKTISLQKNSAMRKLGVESNQSLLSFCITHHLFD